MNGQFEIAASAYPISYLRKGDGHRITDMRNLHPLHSEPISIDLAKRVCAKANKELRAGHFTDEEGISRFVQSEIALAGN